MKYSDFYHIPVAGDGACFFNAIAGINHLNENLWGLKSKPIGVEPNLLPTSLVKNVDKCNLAPKTFNNSTRHNLKNL